MEVLNIRDYGGVVPDGALYVGRAWRGLPGSPLANRYRIGRDGSRTEVIDLYRRWFEYEWAADPGFRDYIAELVEAVDDRGEYVVKALVCHCSPADCHALVIRDRILALRGETLF